MIRGKNLQQCPYGLPIESACKCIGYNIKNMIYLKDVEEDGREKAADHNRSVLFASSGCEKCPFADRIYEENNTVDCKFNPETRTPMVGSVGLTGSPLYPHTFVGEMAKPLYSNFPESEYKDDNISNTYLGLLSFYG
jgi:hypothetical protein